MLKLTKEQQSNYFRLVCKDIQEHFKNSTINKLKFVLVTEGELLQVSYESNLIMVNVEVFEREQLGELQGDPIYLSILYAVAKYLYHYKKLSSDYHKGEDALCNYYAQSVYSNIRAKYETK